ncbi:MAG: hypothetical protein AB1481_06895 [Candidatus Omnitrophota bacterium]
MQKAFYSFFLAFILVLAVPLAYSQQPDELEFTLDIQSATAPLPKIFRPAVDLSGRGFHKDALWPGNNAAKEVLDLWQEELGFSGIYRMQYSLWEISQLDKDKEAQSKLMSNYEDIMRKITESAGIVILSIFGTPQGKGRVLDKTSPPADLRDFKAFVKSLIKELSFNKRYNIWYEVWSAPDIDDFFLGREQEYLNLYRSIAEAVKELRQETKMHIPLGGPSVSTWYQNIDGNTIAAPEGSLIYALIKFCYQYELPLDFISWHKYSTDPQAEKENTIYKKTIVKLMREWLTYFRFDKNTPLIVDEWNYDRSANILPERREEAYICASFLPARIKNMQEAGIDYQIYFSLENFQNNKEGLVRNVGVFSFDPEHSQYQGSSKVTYNAFKMLSGLGGDIFVHKFNDEFAGVIATKAPGSLVLLIYNYIDPEIATNYLSREAGNLKNSERKILLNIIRQGRWDRLLSKEIDITKLRTARKVSSVLKKALELNSRAERLQKEARKLKINLKNLTGNFLYQEYVIDSSCSANCPFIPREEKEVVLSGDYQEELELSPYSVRMLVFKEKPKEEAVAPETAVPELQEELVTPEEPEVDISSPKE